MHLHKYVHGVHPEQLPPMGEGDNVQLPPPRMGQGRVAPCSSPAPYGGPCMEWSPGAPPGLSVQREVEVLPKDTGCLVIQSRTSLSSKSPLGVTHPRVVTPPLAIPMGESGRAAQPRTATAPPHYECFQQTLLPSPLPAVGTCPGEHTQHCPAPNYTSPGSGCCTGLGRLGTLGCPGGDVAVPWLEGARCPLCCSVRLVPICLPSACRAVLGSDQSPAWLYGSTGTVPRMSLPAPGDCPCCVPASTRGPCPACPCWHSRRCVAEGWPWADWKIPELPGWLGSEQPRRGQFAFLEDFCSPEPSPSTSSLSDPRSRGSGAARPAPGDTMSLWGCSTRRIPVPAVMPLTQNLWRHFVRGRKAERPADIPAVGVHGDRTPVVAAVQAEVVPLQDTVTEPGAVRQKVFGSGISCTVTPKQC